MLASKAEDAIPTLIDQGDADQFLAGQLQPAVLAEAARQKDWPLTLRIQPGMITAITLLRPLLRIISASMRSICSDKCAGLMPLPGLRAGFVGPVSEAPPGTWRHQNL
jgi:hypothetical protein